MSNCQYAYVCQRNSKLKLNQRLMTCHFVFMGLAKKREQEIITHFPLLYNYSPDAICMHIPYTA